MHETRLIWSEKRWGIHKLWLTSAALKYVLVSMLHPYCDLFPSCWHQWIILVLNSMEKKLLNYKNIIYFHNKNCKKVTVNHFWKFHLHVTPCIPTWWNEPYGSGFFNIYHLCQPRGSKMKISQHTSNMYFSHPNNLYFWEIQKPELKSISKLVKHTWTLTTLLCFTTNCWYLKIVKFNSCFICLL